MLRLRLTVLALATAGTAVGCRGNSNSGYFDVEPLDNVALHGRLPLSVRPSGGGDAVVLSDVSVNEPTVARVSGASQAGEIIVHGLKATSDVEVAFTGSTRDGLKSDSINLAVVEVENLYFWKGCEDGVYFRGESAGLPYSFNIERGTSALGLGLYPFEVAPRTGLSLKEEESTLDEFVFHVQSDAPALVNVVSTLAEDAGAPESTYALHIVDPVPVQLYPKPDTSGREHGDVTLGLALATMDGTQVCSRFHKRVLSHTPQVCSFGDDRVAVLETFANSAELHFTGYGSCALSLQILELNQEIPYPVIAVEDVDEGFDDDWD